MENYIIAAPFTPMKADGSVDFEEIEPYAEWLVSREETIQNMSIVEYRDRMNLCIRTYNAFYTNADVLTEAREQHYAAVFNKVLNL